MAERLSRPPVKLRPAQPDGQRNGLAPVAKHFLSGNDRPGRKYLIAEVDVAEIRHKVASGVDIAELEIVSIAAPAAQQDLAAMLADALADEFGGDPALFPLTDRARYEKALDAWAEKEDLSTSDVRARWVEHFGEDVPGPVGAEEQLLAEFVLEHAEAYLPDETPEAGA